MPHTTRGATPKPCRSSRPFASSRAAPLRSPSARSAHPVATACLGCVFVLLSPFIYPCWIRFCFVFVFGSACCLFALVLLSFGRSCFAPSGAIAVPAPARPTRPPSLALVMCCATHSVCKGRLAGSRLRLLCLRLLCFGRPSSRLLYTNIRHPSFHVYHPYTIHTLIHTWCGFS